MKISNLLNSIQNSVHYFFIVIILVFTNLGVSNATNWTTASSGAISTLANWTNGTSSPTTFLTPGDTWTITRCMTITSGTHWTLGQPSSANVTLNYATGGSLSLLGNDSLVIYGDVNFSGGSDSFFAAIGRQYYEIFGNLTFSAGKMFQDGNTTIRLINVYGDFIMSGDSILFNGTTPIININIYGNATMNHGYIKCDGTTPQMYIGVYGNYLMTGGTYNFLGTSPYLKMDIFGNCHISGASEMIVDGTSSISEIHMALPSSSGTMFIGNSSTGTWLNTYLYVDTFSIAQLDGNFNTTSGLGVKNNGILICPPAFTVNGTGLFNVSSVGTLKVASPGGIDGNITTTGAISLATNGKYIYNGTSSQLTGVLLPLTLTSPGIITIDNPAGVTLSQNITTTGNLVLNNGILHTGSYSITIPGASSAITGAGPSKFVHGNLNKTIAGLTSINYEVGDVNYSPFTLSLSSSGTSGSLGVKSTSGFHPAFSTSGFFTTNATNRYWTVTNTSAAGPSTIIPKATYNFLDIIGGSNASFQTQKYSGSSWLGAALSTSNTNIPYTSAPTSGIPLSSLVGDYVFGINCASPITGTTLLCNVADTATLSDAVPGGTWTSDNPSIATVSSTTGLVTAVAPGLAVIHYNVGTCSISALVNVGILPIRGITHICPSSTTSLYDSTSGGVWASSNPAVATVSTMGLVSAVSGGTATISYYMGGCTPATTTVLVQSLSAISGVSTMYIGDTVTFSDSITGGTWSSSSTYLATIGTTGLVHGVAYGTLDIIYNLGGCSVSRPLTVLFAYHIATDSIGPPPDTSCTSPSFFIRANGFSPWLYVKTYYGDGTMDSSFMRPSGGGYSYNLTSHHYPTPGYYSVKQILCYSGIAEDSVSFSYYQNYCQVFHTRFFLDLGHTCTKTTADPYNANPISIEVDSAGVPIHFLSATSGFYYKANGGPGTVYSFRIVPGPLNTFCFSSGIWHDTVSSTAMAYPTTFVGVVCSDTVHFDLGVYPTMRCGSHLAVVNILVNNTYCTPENATLTMDFGRLYSFSSASPAPISVAGHIVTWSLNPVSSQLIPYTITADLVGYGLTFGDTMTTHYSVAPITGDFNPVNNTVVIVDTIEASFDPNHVDVIPSGCYTGDTIFQYTIEFENTGNDTAFNIHVLDTLSNQLDLSTMKILAASAPMDVYSYSAGPYNIISFDFPNINLLDSSHHGLCTGEIVFSVKSISGLPRGAVLTNKAGIYFDENPVVMTNMAESINGCGGTLSINNPVIPTVNIYPNPSTGKLTIKAGTPLTSINIETLMGQSVYTMVPNNAQTEVHLDIITLPAGIYLVRVNGTEVRKLIKD